jgi:hypothetical protein
VSYLFEAGITDVLADRVAFLPAASVMVMRMTYQSFYRTSDQPQSVLMLEDACGGYQMLPSATSLLIMDIPF